MKICIPSKDRASEMTTHLYFPPEKVLIFVEPHEIKRYQVHWPDYSFVDIKESNQGVQYVRNFIISTVQDDKILMIDDDSTDFSVRKENGRYITRLFNALDLLKDAERVLEEHWGYIIPLVSFAFFKNKLSNNKRFFINSFTFFGFYGLNIKKLRENNISFDDSFFEGEDCDLSAQIVLADGSICSDYNYAFMHKIRSAGGISSFRKLKKYTYDDSARDAVYMLSKKYGVEFVKLKFDSDGYISGFRLDLKLLAKRKELAKKNVKKYLLEKNSRVMS